MDIARVRFWSEALQRQTAMTLLLPPGRGPFAVLYLLHGSRPHSGRRSISASARATGISP